MNRRGEFEWRLLAPRTRAELAPSGDPYRGAMTSLRERARSSPSGRLAWRTGVAVLGVAVIVAGIILLPLPGPGWLIIFAGLGLLATEFEWAARLLHFARTKVSAWTTWVATQPRPVQALLGLAGLVVLAAAVAAAWWYYTR